jgi:hypothetical protein
MREQLTAKRNVLLKRFWADPSNTRLAIEIRAIDDRIVELTWRMMEHKKNKAEA